MKHREKRSLERFTLALPAQITPLLANGEDRMDVETRNICSGGGFFKTPQPLPVGTEVRVELYLPLSKFESLKDYCKSALINFTGRVSRCEHSGMSILFDSEYQMQPDSNSNSNSYSDSNAPGLNIMQH